MTQADLPVFTARLIELGEVLDASLSETKLLMYFEALSDFELLDVIAAIRTAVKTCKFMPRPSELRALLAGNPEDRTEAAWILFKKATWRIGAYESLVIADPVLAETILAIFGSWPGACESSFSDEMWAAKRKEFGRVFSVFAQRGLTGPRHLRGLTEGANDGIAEWQQYTRFSLLEGDAIKRLSTSDAARYLLPAQTPDAAHLLGEPG